MTLHDQTDDQICFAKNTDQRCIAESWGVLVPLKKKYSILAGTNGFFTWTCPSKTVTNHPQSTGMCHVSSPSHKFPDLEDKEMVDTRRSGNLGSFLPRVMG